MAIKTIRPYFTVPWRSPALPVNLFLAAASTDPALTVNLFLAAASTGNSPARDSIFGCCCCIMAFGAFTIEPGPSFFATVSVAALRLHRKRAVSYISILSNSTCVHRVYPCTDWLYCIGPEGTAMATSHMRGSRGWVLYSTIPRRARRWKSEATICDQLSDAFLHCNTISNPFQPTLSSTLSTPPLAQHSTSAEALHIT